MESQKKNYSGDEKYNFGSFGWLFLTCRLRKKLMGAQDSYELSNTVRNAILDSLIGNSSIDM